MKVVIFGLGRIGRAVLKRFSDGSEGVEVCLLCDKNSDIHNIEYLLNYDSVYGVSALQWMVSSEGYLTRGEARYSYAVANTPADIDWNTFEIDLIIDSTGVDFSKEYEQLLSKHKDFPRVVISHQASWSDISLVYGVNHELFSPSQHKIISSSICDVHGVAPFYQFISRLSPLDSLDIITLHPWLNYQNLLDGPLESVSSPGHKWSDYALGRSSVNSLIPKGTTVLAALEKIFPEVESFGTCMSFRVPTSIVSSAIITWSWGEFIADETDFRRRLLDFASKSGDAIFLQDKQLISIDFANNMAGSVLDLRWLELRSDGKGGRVVCWYDNEMGYSSRLHALVCWMNRSDY